MGKCVKPHTCAGGARTCTCCAPRPHTRAAALLAKRDRGRGADLTAAPSGYGVAPAAERVDGAQLLQDALARGDATSGASSGCSSSGADSDSSAGDSDGELEGGSGGSDAGGTSEHGGGSSREQGSEELSSSSGGGGELSSDGASEDELGAAGARLCGSSGAASASASRAAPNQRAAQPGSLADLKRQLAAASAAGPPPATAHAPGATGQAGAADVGLDPSLPIEMQRILSQDDFRRIKCVQRRRRLAGRGLGKLRGPALPLGMRRRSAAPPSACAPRLAPHTPGS